MREIVTYEGRLQGVGDGYVLGWVWAPAQPQERVPVTVLVDGLEAASGLADCEREDLSRLGIGDGAHGFLLPLPDNLSGPGRLEVVAAAGLEKSFVLPSPSFWQEAPPDSRWIETTFVAGSRMPLTVAQLPDRPPVEVAPGLDGWRFKARRHEPVPGAEEVDSALQGLRVIAEGLRALGIAVVVGCLPSKASVIGEEYAGDLAERSEWLRALTEAHHDVDGIELFDLLPALHAARHHGTAYDRASLDLNGLGAFFAVRALLKEAAKQCPAVGAPQLSDLHLSAEPGGQLVPAWHARRALRMPVEEHLVTDPEMHVRLYAREDFPSDLRLALVAESDALGLLPWLAECANRTTYFCARIPPMTQVELEMPDAVIWMLSEDELHTLAKDHARISPADLSAGARNGRPTSSARHT